MAAVNKRNADGNVSKVASYNPRNAPLETIGVMAAKKAIAL